MSKIMNTVTPALSTTVHSSSKLSSLKLMMLIHKINEQLQKTSNEAFKAKKVHLSIFETRSNDLSSSKLLEGFSILSLSVLAGSAQLGSQIASPLLKQALEISAKIIPHFSQPAKSIFESRELNLSTLKHIANIELDSSRDVQNKIEDIQKQNEDKLAQLVEKTGSLNRLR
jgi:hypothetical protein